MKRSENQIRLDVIRWDRVWQGGGGGGERGERGERRGERREETAMKKHDEVQLRTRVRTRCMT